jgi:hypothetical protein
MGLGKYGRTKAGCRPKQMRSVESAARLARSRTAVVYQLIAPFLLDDWHPAIGNDPSRNRDVKIAWRSYAL